MNQELKECPFCNAGETRIDERHHSPTMSGAIKEPISVTIRHWCPKKEGQPSGLNFSFIGRDRASAIAAWNTRAPIPAPTPSAEAVRVAQTWFKNLGDGLDELQRAIEAAADEPDWDASWVIKIIRGYMTPADQQDEDAAKALEALDKLTGRHGTLSYHELGIWVTEYCSEVRAALQAKAKGE